MPPPAPGVAGGPIEALPTAVTGFVGAADEGPVDSPVTVSSAADYYAVFGPGPDPGRPLGHAVDLFFANGGRQAVVCRAAGPAPEQLVPPGGAGGLHALDESGVTVLVVPGLTTDHPEQVRVALAWCAAYRAVLLLDLPSGTWTSGLRTSLDDVDEHRERAAVYHPWVLVDGLAVPPSGAVAGVIARTDAERGVQKAPAGVELRGITGFTEALDHLRTDELTGAGVNTLREFPGRGRLVWGARTLAGAQTGDPAARYLSVRRLTDHVLASLTAGLGFVADRPSEVTLWADVQLLTRNFLHALWIQGAFVGTTADKAYGVRCGLGQTMSEADVRAGRVVLTLWMATLRPAEFDAYTLTLQAAVPPSGPGGPGRADPEREVVGRHDLRPVARGRARPGPKDLDRVRPSPVDVRQVRLDRTDLGQVVSRYLGETEKNVGRLLDHAQRSAPVLGFDEADALFGRRTEARESTDEPDASRGRPTDGRSSTSDPGTHDPPEEPEPR